MTQLAINEIFFRRRPFDALDRHHHGSGFDHEDHGGGLDPKHARIADIMSGYPISCHAEDDVLRASHAMDEFNIRRVPVVDYAWTLLGIISRTDLGHRSEPVAN